MINFSSRQSLVSLFIGSITKSGKKSKAVKMFSFFLSDIEYVYNVNSLEFLEKVLNVVRPKTFLVSKKISGNTVRIPTPITLKRSYSIAVRWFLASVSKRSGETFNELMMQELNDIYSNPNNATLRKRDEYHKLAKINRSFLRFNKF